MQIVVFLVAVIGAGALGYGGNYVINKQKNADGKEKANKIIEDAKVKSKEQTLQAKEEALKIIEDAKDEDKKRRERLDGQEKRSLEREKLLDSKIEAVERRAEALHNDEKEI